MKDFANSLDLKEPPPRPLLPAPDREMPELSPPHPSSRPGGAGRLLLGVSIFALVAGGLGIGVWQHYQQHRQIVTTAEQQTAYVPSVRAQPVTHRDGTIKVSLPGTTL